MNTPIKFTKLVTKSLPVFGLVLLASCGDYATTIPSTPQQTLSQMPGFPTISGRPNLRTPSAIGILTTGRTDAMDFGNTNIDLTKSGNIRSMQSINAMVSSGDYHQLNDVLTKRAKLIHDTKFLGLDIILVCDQMTDTSRDLSPVQLVTLGLLDLGTRKQNTKLTVLCMDARTGYIYGVMGQQEDGNVVKLTLVESNLFGDPNRSRLVTTTRRDAVKQFPAFWNQVVEKYGK
ncbi:MAG: hypothetical protein HC845_00330 [Akkermansiaceae bacterium]|nr:hypothetical protein [Akkermansiaceae bacterium]